MPTNQPGINIFSGAPPIDELGSVTTGAVFYVGSAAVPGGVVGVDSGEVGQRPQQPYATTDYAVGQCTATRGDVIYVLPGHRENISAATSLVVDVAGVQIIGLGRGVNRPYYTFTATAGSIELDAACRLSNVVLRASVSAVVVGVNVDADGVEIDNVETTWEDTGDDFAIMIDVTAFDRATIRNCKLYTEPATAGAVTGILLVDTHNTRILDNEIIGQWSNAPINGATTLGNECLIMRNLIYNSDTTTDNGILITAAFTGILADNRVGTLYATSYIELIDPGSMLCFENYAVNAIDESAIIFPQTTPT
jgi:hypothetical protein